MIERTQDGDVAVLTLCHGKASALDLEFCESLERAVAAEEDSPARAIVLTGRGAIFSAGVDLKRLLAGGAAYVDEFLPALDAALLVLFRCDKPLVAAINGHAIAGGALLAGACDLRLLARGPATIGVPELKVGVPFPQAAVEIAHELFPPAVLGPALYTGRTWNAEEALAAGIVHELVEPAELLPRALAQARELAAIPASSYGISKRLRRAAALERLERDGPRAAHEVREAWSSPEVLAAVEGYVARTLRR
ncbi:MAG: enoyl-CoA hydratase/isomerase family protein [Planctomycetes bacterium]|nr:enoyl-CoA hydratase/isomerase family protein [Planctomycetota bacterium]